MYTIGSRLKFIRSLASLNRSQISKQINISINTLYMWENDGSCISSRSIERCISAYRTLGIEMSREWLEHGLGEKPKLIILNNINKKIVRLLESRFTGFTSYIDKNKRFIYVNKNYNIFDLPTEDIISKSASEVMGYDKYNACKPFIAQALLGKKCNLLYPWKEQDEEYISKH